MGKDWVKIAAAHRPHGLRGGFVIKPYNSEINWKYYCGGIPLRGRRIGENGKIAVEGSMYELEKVHGHPKKLAYLKGIASLESIAALLPMVFEVATDLLPPKADDEVYLEELLNLEVFHFESGELVGRVHNHYFNGAQDILVIARSNGGDEIELPFIPQFFPVVDEKAGRVEINFPTFV